MGEEEKAAQKTRQEEEEVTCWKGRAGLVLHGASWCRSCTSKGGASSAARASKTPVVRALACFEVVKS
eukprot:2726796-Rhodomonas_salina.2